MNDNDTTVNQYTITGRQTANKIIHMLPDKYIISCNNYEGCSINKLQMGSFF